MLNRETAAVGAGRIQPHAAATSAATATAAVSPYAARETPAPAPNAEVASPIAVPDENEAFASAVANAFALSNRSAGTFSSAFATAAATLGGTVFRYFVTAAAGSAM